MWTTTADTDASGHGEFMAVFSPQLPASQFMSMTATDQDGNTSEFSPSWPLKVLKLVDGRGNAIGNRTLAMSRVTGSSPSFNEIFIDSVTTDSTGQFDVTDYVRAGPDSETATHSSSTAC